MNEKNLADQNQSCEINNAVVMTPRGRRSRQKIKFELLVNEFNESLNTSDMKQGGYGQNTTPSSQ